MIGRTMVPNSLAKVLRSTPEGKPSGANLRKGLLLSLYQEIQKFRVDAIAPLFDLVADK